MAAEFQDLKVTPAEAQAIAELPREILVRVRLEADDRLSAMVDRLVVMLGGIFHVAETKCPHGLERNKNMYCGACMRTV